MDIIVDPEFERLMRPLTEQEYRQLECSVLDDGVLSPLVVWAPHNILLDGHHRLRICRKHDIPFAVTALAFDTREQALQWVEANQKGRRNLTPEEAAYIRGNTYRTADKQQGNRSDLTLSSPDAAGNKPGNAVQGTLAHSEPKLDQRTARRVAKEHHVSASTIKRDAQFAEALDSLVEVFGNAFRDKVIAGTSGLTKKDVIALSEMSRAELATVADDRKAMKALVKEWRSRAHDFEDTPKDSLDAEEDATPEREAAASTAEGEHLRAIVGRYRGALESIVQVCHTDGVGEEGLCRLLDDVAVIAEDALALEVEDTAPEAMQ